MLYDDYIAYCSTYTQKYGERVVVLMEVGSFFEFYAGRERASSSFTQA